jgi:hypothetical protein
MFTYGMNHTFSEFAQMAYSRDVYLLRKESKLLRDVIHHHMEDIMGHSAHMQRSGSVNSFGRQCMKTQEILSKGVDHVRGMAISIQEMPCHSLTTFRSSSLMSRRLITWAIPTIEEV